MSVVRNTRKPNGVKADLAQRKAAAEARAKAQIDVLMAEMVLRRCRETADALERLQMRASLGFYALADVLAPQPWAMANGMVLGHLLTMPEEAYQAAISADHFDVASLDAAMEMDWSDASEYEVWAQVYADVLGSLADMAVQRAQAFRQREELKLVVSGPCSDPDDKDKNRGGRKPGRI